MEGGGGGGGGGGGDSSYENLVVEQFVYPHMIFYL